MADITQTSAEVWIQQLAEKLDRIVKAANAVEAIAKSPPSASRDPSALLEMRAALGVPPTGCPEAALKTLGQNLPEVRAVTMALASTASALSGLVTAVEMQLTHLAQNGDPNVCASPGGFAESVDSEIGVTITIKRDDPVPSGLSKLPDETWEVEGNVKRVRLGPAYLGTDRRWRDRAFYLTEEVLLLNRVRHWRQNAVEMTFNR